MVAVEQGIGGFGEGVADVVGVVVDACAGFEEFVEVGAVDDGVGEFGSTVLRKRAKSVAASTSRSCWRWCAA